MPTQINESIDQQGNYSNTQPDAFRKSPWLQQDDDNFNLTQLLHIVRRRSLIMAGVAVAVASLFWGWTLTRTPIYRGSFRVLIESVDESNPSQDLTPSPRELQNSTVDYDTQIEVLGSTKLLQPIHQELQKKYSNLTVEELSEGLSISRIRETKVLEISYRDSDPQKIQDILEETAQQYLEYSYEQRQASLTQGMQFVEDELPDLRDRVNTLQVQVERFQQQYSFLDPAQRGDDLSSLISRVEDERQQLQSELSQARSLFQSLQNQLNISPEEALAAATLSESPRYQSLLNQLQELEAQLAVEAAKYQPDSPQLAVIRERRDNLIPILEAEAADILGDRFAASPSNQVDGNLTPTSIDLSRQLINAANDVQMLQARSQTLAQVEQNIKQEFALVPGLARQYTDMKRELSIASESLNRFLSTRETLQIDAAQKSVPWQLIAEPSTSPIPISPNIPRNLVLGILAGLGMGAGAAFLVEKLDQVYHSPEELKQATKLPLLGTVPYHPTLEEQVDNNPHAIGFTNSSGKNTAVLSTPKQEDRKHRNSFRESMFVEAFRTLYRNIRFLGSDYPIRSLVVSSAATSEGKSTVAFYLAKAAAVMGQRVLLVDADLRSPKLHIRLNLSNARGLSNLISESLPVRHVIQRAPLNENISVLTAGSLPPDPVKLLSSQRMQTLMREFHETYDFIVYDMPSIIGLADSSLVAANTNGMVFITSLGKTERHIIKQAINEVKLSSVTILGIVANGIKSYITDDNDDSQDHRHHQDDSYSNATDARAIASKETPTNPPPTSYPSLPPYQSSVKNTSTFDSPNPSDSSYTRGWQYDTSITPQSPSALPGGNGYALNEAKRSIKNHSEPPHTLKISRQSSPPHLTSWVGRPSRPFSRAEVATVAPNNPLIRFLRFEKVLMGTGITIVFGAIGWLLYTRVVPNKSMPPEVISEQPSSSRIEESSSTQETVPSETEFLTEPPHLETDSTGTEQPAEVSAESSVDEVPESNNDVSEVTSERSVDAEPDEGIETLTSDPIPLEISPEVRDPYAEAERIAVEATVAGEIASTPEEWARIAEHWQRASALMVIVPQTDERFSVARDRSVLYRNNSEFARQQVLETLSTNNSNHTY